MIIKESLQRDLFRLYQLIWKRFAASRMEAARYHTTIGKNRSRRLYIYADRFQTVFDGFMSVYVQDEEKEERKFFLGKLEKGMTLELEELVTSQHFTQPPAHYTEASLVKALEEQGIGRPSTYAPTITTIISQKICGKGE